MRLTVLDTREATRLVAAASAIDRAIELSRSTVAAVIRNDGSVVAKRDWLTAAGIARDGPPAATMPSLPLHATLLLTQSCDQLRSVVVVRAGSRGAHPHVQALRDGKLRAWAQKRERH
jgi:hypothetical protein